MYKYILTVFVVLGFLYTCGEDRALLTGSTTGPTGPALGKTVSEQLSFAQVLLTLRQDG